jgi:hypothetical protein
MGSRSVSRVVTLRLSDDTAARLRAWARRAGRSVSEMGARSIEEWLRQQEFADIEFRALGGERSACLKGAAPVWQVVMIGQRYNMDPEQTAAHFDWPVHRARAAFNYYQAFPQEIDQAIADNEAMTFERLQRLLPQVERFTDQPIDSAADAPG